MSTVSAGQSVQLRIGAFDGLWVNCSGVGFVDFECKSRGTIQLTTQYQRIGFYGEDICVELRCISGVIDYSTTPVEFSPLTARQGGDSNDSSPLEIKLAVNGLRDGSIGFDGISLKDLPQTAESPAGYGDLASAVNSMSGNSVKTVIPTGHATFRMYTEFDGSLYGVLTSSDTLISIMTASGTISTYGNSLPANNISSVKFISGSTIIAEADNGTGVYKLYLSTNSGSSWSMVYDNVTAAVKTLTDRSICVADINGSTALLYGQYNVNGSRTPGSTNDAVRLLRSDDLGATWYEVTRWNTDGSTRNIRHIHCVKQDPITKRIYVATGDSNAESCIYSWDGASTWPINVSPANTVQSSGLKVIYGAQRFRAVDILFRDSYMYWMPDTNSGSTNYASDIGIWRVDTQFAEQPQRVSSAGAHLVGNAGWLVAETDDGTAYWCTGVDTPTAGFVHSAIIASNRSLSEWKAVGAFRAANLSQPAPYGFAAIGNTVYHSTSNGSGKGAENTVWFIESPFYFRGDLSTVYELDTIHPVYWVDPVSGSNANNGWSPSSAFASVDYAAAGDRATYGARIQLPEGVYNYSGDTVNPKINANARGGDVVEPCYIQGHSATRSLLVFTASATATAGFSLLTSANSPRFGVKAVTCYSEKNIRLLDLFGANCHFYISQAMFGATQFANPVLLRNESGYIYNYSSVILGSSTVFTTATSGSGVFRYYGDKVAIYGGADQFRLTTTATTHVFRGVDVDFNGFSSNAIETTAGDFADFYMKRCRFASANTGVAALAGASSGWNSKMFDCLSSVSVGVSAAVFGGLEPCTNVIESNFSAYVD